MVKIGCSDRINICDLLGLGDLEEHAVEAGRNTKDLRTFTANPIPICHLRKTI